MCVWGGRGGGGEGRRLEDGWEVKGFDALVLEMKTDMRVVDAVLPHLESLPAKMLYVVPGLYISNPPYDTSYTLP